MGMIMGMDATQLILHRGNIAMRGTQRVNRQMRRLVRSSECPCVIAMEEEDPSETGEDRGFIVNDARRSSRRLRRRIIIRSESVLYTYDYR